MSGRGGIAVGSSDRRSPSGIRIAWGALLVGGLVLAVLAIGGGERGSPSPALEALPRFHALLNATSALLLVTGWTFIRARRRRAHAACMIAAALATAVFLVSYLIYHFKVGSIPFRGQGWIRPVYFTLLITHAALAAVVAPMAATVMVAAARRRFDEHRPLARVTLPLWLYVSLTGVLIYLMLYVWFPA